MPLAGMALPCTRQGLPPLESMRSISNMKCSAWDLEETMHTPAAKNRALLVYAIKVHTQPL